MKSIMTMAACAAAAAALAQSPAHDALRREIAELQKRPEVYALPPYLPAEKDFAEVCARAGEQKKKVLVSIGREACGRCQRFYEMVRRGVVKVDPAKFEFVRLDIDEHAQREYFMDAFEPKDGQLPFVGVTDAARTKSMPCLTGARTAAEYQALMGPAGPLEGAAVFKMTEAQLVEVAKCGDGNDRVTACQELGHRGTASSVPALAAMLGEPDPAIFHAALYALANIPGGEADAALSAAEASAAAGRREAIAHVRTARAKGYPALDAYKGATEAVTAFPPKTPAQKGDMAAFAAIVEAATSGGHAGNLARLQLVGFPGKGVEGALLAMARGDDAKKSRLAFSVLGERKARGALKELLDMARNPASERMRRGALNALSQVCDPRRDMPALLELLAMAPDDEQMRSTVVRVAAAAFDPANRRVKVVDAKFGNFESRRVADVKLMVESLLEAGSREIMSGCRLVGRGGFHHDPAPGKSKELRISYSIDGGPVRCDTVQENSVIAFSENVLCEGVAKTLVDAALAAKGAYRTAVVHVISALDRRGVVPGSDAVLFRPLFNGRDLSGWRQNGDFFSARDGILVGESTPEKPCAASQYLVYGAEQFGDFELRCSFRLGKTSNSGIQVRSTDSMTKDTGYQADMDGSGSIVGYFYCTGQHLVGKRGCDVVISSGGRKSVTAFADDAELQKVYREGEWNDLRVVAKGSALAMWVNGVRMASVMDGRSSYLPEKGYISIQLHQGRPMKAEFRDIRVRTTDVSLETSLETALLQRLYALSQGEAPSFEGASWIWHKNGQRDGAKVAFKAELELPQGEIDRAGLVFSCDDSATFSINGREVASQTGAKLWYTPTAVVDAQRTNLAVGRNVIEVAAANDKGCAAFIAAIEVEYKDGRIVRLHTGPRGWTASLGGSAPEAPTVIAPYGDGPYGRFKER